MGRMQGNLVKRKREFLARPVYLSEGLKERLKQARLDLTPKRGGFVSQEVLAAEIGVSGATLGNWESGAYEPSLMLLEKLAKVLGVSPAYLAFGTVRLPMEEGGEVPAERPTRRLRRKGA